MPVILVANHKGGVGKTMFTAALAAELGRAGLPVLAVDLDPQANLTRRFGYNMTADADEFAGRPTMATALLAATPEAFTAALVPCQWPMDWADNIHIAPGHHDLDLRAGEAGNVGSWLRLRRALAAVPPSTVVLVDTPPTMGHLLVVALAAADHVLAVTHAEFDAVRGAHHLNAFIDVNREALGLRANLDGVIVNALRPRVAVHMARTEELQAGFGDLLWEPTIPLRAVINDNQERAMPPQHGDAKMGKAFAALADRVRRTMINPAEVPA